MPKAKKFPDTSVPNPEQRVKLAPAVVQHLSQLDAEIGALQQQKNTALALVFAQAGVDGKPDITGFDPATGEILYVVA